MTVRILQMLLGALLLVASSRAVASPSSLRIPLGLDVFLEVPARTGGPIAPSRRSVVETRMLGTSGQGEILHVRAIGLGTVTLRFRTPAAPAFEVNVVPSDEAAYAEFVQQEVVAGRIVEPLPLVVGEPPFTLVEERLGNVVVSDDLRARVERRKRRDRRESIAIVPVAAGWTTVTLFDAKFRIARRFAFHVREGAPPQSTAAGDGASDAERSKAIVAPIPEAQSGTPASAEPLGGGGEENAKGNGMPTVGEGPPVEDPPPVLELLVPVDIGIIVPFASSIPAIVAEPRELVEYRRLTLPSGRQALYVIGRAPGRGQLRISDGQGALRHEIRARVVPPDARALTERCELERRAGGLCEAVRVRVGELKIVDAGAPIGAVFSAERNLLRYARRPGADGERELSLQPLAPGVADLNLFDGQGVLRRRLVLQIQGATGESPFAAPAPTAPVSLPVPK